MLFGSEDLKPESKTETMDSQSREQTESRKRALDTDGDDGMTKRSNQGNLDPSSRDDVHLKMLVPSCAAGAVIGKGGETIGKLQRETGAKMKMSKNQDTFPGTSERVCLIVGTVSACELAHEEVAQIISDKPDPQPKPNTDGDGKINYQRHQQTKFLVPNASAGVIIGKGGSYIKELKERSGSHVNVSHKGDNPERIVTVSGDVSEIRSAMTMLLEKLAADPQSSLYSSLNYAGMHHGGGNMSTPSNSFTNLSGGGSMGGLHLGNMGGGAMTPHQVQQAAQSLSTMMRSFNNLGSGINNMNIGASARPRNPVLEQLVQTLKMTGYTDVVAEEIAAALSTLANYGVLSLTGGSLLGNLMNLNRLNLNSNSSSGAGGQSSVPSLLGGASSQNSRMGNDQSSGGYGGSSDDDGASLLRQLTQTLARSQGKSGGSGGGDMYGPVGGGKESGGDGSLFGNGSVFGEGNGGSFGNFNQQSGSPEPQDSQEIEVAENLAGAIIGQQGRGITEIQHMTGANVSVSRRGVYAPGTQNRIVTVSGPSSGVNRAALLVRQKIQDAEQRRAQTTSTY